MVYIALLFPENYVVHIRMFFGPTIGVWYGFRSENLNNIMLTGPGTAPGVGLAPIFC